MTGLQKARRMMFSTVMEKEFNGKDGLQRKIRKTQGPFISSHPTSYTKPCDLHTKEIVSDFLNIVLRSPELLVKDYLA